MSKRVKDMASVDDTGAATTGSNVLRDIPTPKTDNLSFRSVLETPKGSVYYCPKSSVSSSQSSALGGFTPKVSAKVSPVVASNRKKIANDSSVFRKLTPSSSAKPSPKSNFPAARSENDGLRTLNNNPAKLRALTPKSSAKSSPFVSSSRNSILNNAIKFRGLTPASSVKSMPDYGSLRNDPCGLRALTPASSLKISPSSTPGRKIGRDPISQLDRLTPKSYRTSILDSSSENLENDDLAWMTRGLTPKSYKSTPKSAATPKVKKITIPAVVDNTQARRRASSTCNHQRVPFQNRSRLAPTNPEESGSKLNSLYVTPAQSKLELQNNVLGYQSAYKTPLSPSHRSSSSSSFSSASSRGEGRRATTLLPSYQTDYMHNPFPGTQHPIILSKNLAEDNTGSATPMVKVTSPKPLEKTGSLAYIVDQGSDKYKNQFYAATRTVKRLSMFQ
eukprot:Platyproteum_vivax@DN12416_c0_g1_i1.p1